MPPVMRPEAISSSQAEIDMVQKRLPFGLAKPSPNGYGLKPERGLLPGRLVRVELGRDYLHGPDHLKLAVLPLPHGARRSRVFTAGELDVANDGLVRVASHVVADRLAVQPHFGDGRLHDLQARPAVTTGPAVRLLAAKFLGVRIEVSLGGRAGLAVP